MKPNDIRDAMSQATVDAVERVGRPRVVALLASLGARSVCGLDRSKWIDYLEAVQALQPPPPPVRTATLYVDYAVGERVQTRIAGTSLKVVGYEVRYILEREDSGRPYANGESMSSEGLLPAAKAPEAPTPWAPSEYSYGQPLKAPTDKEWSLFANHYPFAYQDARGKIDSLK